MKRVHSTPRPDWQATAQRLGFAFHTFDGEPYWDKRRDPHLYGRMDLCYDGHGPAKLLETNYDTPTSLYEASFFQYVWLEQQMQRGQLPAGCDQFNSIEDKLLQAFVQGGFGSPLYFSSVRGSVEDRGTVEYICATSPARPACARG